METQKGVFLNSEGDAWFKRNRKSIGTFDNGMRSERATDAILRLPLETGSHTKILEIGCGQGLRLQELAREKQWSCVGIDPSKDAVNEVRKNGLDAYVGTADRLEFDDCSFDIITFGFCLYLCDQADLFKIASEAHRVLKPDSWIVIIDFWSDRSVLIDYKHYNGIKSHKMDFQSMFTWHPHYTLFEHTIRGHDTKGIIDDPNEWVGVSVLRRRNA